MDGGVMDIQRDEAFEEAYSNICKPIIARPYPRNENGEYFYKEIHEAHLMWQAAKANAVPDGHKLVPVEPSEAMYLSGFRAKQDGLNTIEIYKAMIEAQEPSND